MEQLTEEQKASLRGMIESPLLSFAFSEALRNVHNEQKGKESIDTAAMAYSYLCGASNVLSHLFTMAESKKENPSVTPRKLRH